MRRTVAVLVLAVLAGCSGVGSAPTPAPSTPAPVPTDRPGAVASLAESGTLPADELARTHAEALQGRSYTLRWTRNVTAGNVTLDEVRLVFHVGADGGYLVERVERSSPGYPPAATYAELGVWYHDGVVRNRFVDESGTERYWGSDRPQDGGPVRTLQRERDVRQTVGAFDLSLAESGVEDGHYRLVSTEVVDPVRLRLPAQLDRPTDGRLSVVVGRSGIVRDYRLTFDARYGNETVEVAERYRVIDVGNTTVPDPAWAEQAST